MSSRKPHETETPEHGNESRSLDDADITTVKTDRRSFLARTMVAGSIALGAAATAACPGGGSNDGTDSDSDAQ